MKKRKLYWQLFISTFVLSAFTFGGGYVIITLMQRKFVDELKWIDKEEMLDLVAIAQSSPGAIAVNGAIVIGYKLAGLFGVFICVFATVLPPFIIISVLSVFYTLFKENLIVKLMLGGMQAGVGAVIASVVFDMAASLFKEQKERMLSGIILIVAFLADAVFRINVVIIILACILTGILKALIERKKTA